jgi:hypothetical protein
MTSSERLISQEPPLRVVPRAEDVRAPGFAPVIARFRAAVRAKDVDAILSMMTNDILPSFGSETRGPKAFRDEWKIDSPTSEFWSMADEVLSGGSALEGPCEATGVCDVLYPFWARPFADDFDRLGHLVVRGSNVPMYSRPRAGGRAVATLSYDVVKSVDDQPNWTEIELQDGRRGFVRAESLYDLAFGPRMAFSRTADGRWVLGEFIAGD